LQESIDDD
jgi:hypothetical protein